SPDSQDRPHHRRPRGGGGPPAEARERGDPVSQFGSEGAGVRGFDMSATCLHVRSMSKMIQIRHVPDDLHRTLKARAAAEGMSLSDYLLRELRQLAEQPTPAEFLERLRQREPVKLRVSPAAIIRAMREGR